MAHFAKLDKNNIVVEVLVVDNDNILDEDGNESESIGAEYINTLLETNDTWIQTSYNSNFRKHYATIGGTYDPVNDAFIGIQPFPSWSLDSEFNWEAPEPLPTEWINKDYYWDEDSYNEGIGGWHLSIPE